MCTAVLIGLNPANPPPPAFGLIYEGAIGQPRWTTSLCDPQLAMGGQNRPTIGTGGPHIRDSKGIAKLALDAEGGLVVVTLKPPSRGTAEIITAFN